MMHGNDILFYLPQIGFLILLGIPLLYAQFSLNRYRQRQQHSYASSHLLSRLIIPRSFGVFSTKAIGWALIWAFACLALMQPFGNIRYSPLTTPSSPHSVAHRQSPLHEVIFLVDHSPSMRVPDGLDGETRLEEAKNIMEDVIRQMRGQTVSLYAFAAELKTIVPPTLDYIFARLAIKDLSINREDKGGTRLAVVLESLKERAFPQPSSKHYTVILLTDGGDTQLEELKGVAREEKKKEILAAIPNPQQFHLHLLTIGIGSLKPQPIPNVSFNGQPVSSKLEPGILKELAAQGRGVYYMAQEWSSWNLARELTMRMKENDVADRQSSTERQVMAVHREDVIVDLYYQIPLGLALLFYCFNILLPDVRRL